MRSIGRRLPILAMTILALSCAPGAAQEVLYLETADWIPTASVLTVPTSYVAATAYVLPTSYAVPTVYATAYLTETAMVAPTTYLEPTYYETRFRRRGLFGRRLVETSRADYLPTTAYYPTTYFYPTTFASTARVDRAVVPTVYATTASTACCGEVVQSAAVRDVPVSSEPARPAAPAASRPRATRREQPPVRSEPTEAESIPSDVPELPTREADAAQAGDAQTATEAARAQGNRGDSPPAPQPPKREPSTVRSTPSAPGATKAAQQGQGATGGNAGEAAAQPKAQPRPASPAPASNTDLPKPVAPSEGEELQPAPDERTTPRSGRQTRDSQKPVLTTPRSLRPDLRNVLFGRVKARGSNEAEEGVRVTLSNRQNTAESREALTDAFGRFAVRVPDGDWTVSVTMPSGRVYSVSQINVTGGQITDEIGRDVPSLVITR